MSAKIKSSSRYVIELNDLGQHDKARAGTKAINEGILLKAGFQVPDGFVLTTDSFELFLRANALPSNCTLEVVAAAPIPVEIAKELHAAVQSLGEAPLAVRSSAVSEDLPGASFAGQYETILNVNGGEALEEAVRRCWASVFNSNVAAYREAHGLPAGSTAVLIQKLIPAEFAGVAFSANPVSGDRTEVVINAVRGLGERFVSGAASPDEWTVKGGRATRHSSPEEAITAEQVLRIAEAARQIEALFGNPQDIEWALFDDQLHILQSRPITTLPNENPEMKAITFEPPPGLWQREPHRPNALYPISRLEYGPLEIAIQKWVDEFGLLMEGIEVREIGGWEYTQIKPLGGKEGPLLPKPLMWLLVRAVPMMRARLKQASIAIRTDKAGRYIQRWYDEWYGELKSEMEVLRDTSLTGLSDEALDEHLQATVSFFAKAIEVRILTHGGESIILYDLVTTCRELLGWHEAKTFELVNGTSFMSTEPAKRIQELVEMVRQRSQLSKLLERIDVTTAKRLTEIDREFADALGLYMKDYGCRTLADDIVEQTLAENPALVLQLIRDQIVYDYDPLQIERALEKTRKATAREARTKLAGRSLELARFERVLQRAIQAYPVREDAKFYTVNAPYALIRYSLLEVGRRLTERNCIAHHEDIFYLELEELRTALLNGGDYHFQVKHRKGERAWAEANPGPPTYGGEVPETPTLDFLPTEARFIMESLLWYENIINAHEQNNIATVAEGTLSGIAASSGKYTGPACIVMNESEFHKLQPGDVLVCPITSPVWSILFPIVGALVTDTGGILSHPAIIAREYAVPAVVATNRATSMLQDGQLITVDGSKGTILILS